MKVILNSDACTGHGRCYVLAPDVFDADEEGYSVLKVADVPPELEAQARAGVANCPERAISIEE
ncbi:MAG: ferredoxin [Acidimicrobiia bacterium]